MLRIIRRNPSMFIRDREKVIPEVDQLGTVNGCGHRDRWRCWVVDEYLPDWDCDVPRPANCDPADSFPVDRPDSAYEIANGRGRCGAEPRTLDRPATTPPQTWKCCKSGASRTDGCDRCRSLVAEQANISGAVKPVIALGAARRSLPGGVCCAGWLCPATGAGLSTCSAIVVHVLVVR